MNRKAILVTLLIVGIVLCTGPLWGVLAGLISMMHTFGSGGPIRSEDVARGIQTTLVLTTAGWIALPFGFGAVIGTSLLLAHIRKKTPT